MAFTRIKQEKNSVEAARAKLNVALQNVSEKKDESPSTSSDDDSNRDSGTAEITVKSEPVPIASTLTVKRQPQRTQRKRRRKDDCSLRNSNTYVMKLFDRAVDLSPFSEETPLYPICRAWINNQPHQTSTEASDEEQIKEENQSTEVADNFENAPDEQGSKDIFQLPIPLTLAKEHSKDLRIPSPIPAPEEEFVICSDVLAAPPKEDLMKKHMERWKAVRQKWKKAAQINEDRYRKSGKILKAVYERSQHREDFDNNDPWETKIV